MKAIFLSILVVHITWCDDFLDGVNLYEKSSLWPPFASLTENFKDGCLEIKQGTRGVLIRLSDYGRTVLIDFGRKGVHMVNMSSTDVMTEAKKLNTGTNVKHLPNLTTLLHSRLVKIENGKPRHLTTKDLSKIKFFLCIRFENTLEAWKAVSEIINSIEENCDPQFIEYVLFPEALRLSDPDVVKLIESHDILNANYMYSFLSQNYMDILWHDLPVKDDHIEIAEFDANGKLLNYSTQQVRITN